jgi:hypothetical protein
VKYNGRLAALESSAVLLAAFLQTRHGTIAPALRDGLGDWLLTGRTDPSVAVDPLALSRLGAA